MKAMMISNKEDKGEEMEKLRKKLEVKYLSVFVSYFPISSVQLHPF
jgi:hypothetical protein